MTIFKSYLPNMHLKNIYTPIYILTISIVIFLVLPFLLQDGMFMDGIQYACVSKNLANGVGSFWFPILSDTWYMQNSQFFMEHPPLFYGIESIFFRLLGDSFYTERVFSFIMLLFATLFIHLIWDLTSDYFGHNKNNSWYAILLWIITPVCFWTFQNHMIETLLSVFTLGAVYFSLKAILNKKMLYFNLVLSGVLIFCSFLTKGFPGLFPFVTIPLFYMIFKLINFRQTCFYLGIILLTFILVYLIIFLFNNSASDSLKFYLTKRLVNRIEATSTINYRFFIMRDLFFEFLPSMLICLVLYLFSIRKKEFVKLKSNCKKMFLFMVLLGFSASVPIMITMVQKNFYLVPSIPFFALAIAFINTDFLDQKLSILLLNQNTNKVLKITAFTVLFFVLFFSGLQINKISRDESLLKDVRVIGDFLKNEKIVSVDSDTYYSWSFQFYILRYYGVQLDTKNKTRMFYITKNEQEFSKLFQYKQIQLPTTEYKLYKMN